jgi:hypothetical protein
MDHLSRNANKTDPVTRTHLSLVQKLDTSSKSASNQ